MPLPIDVKPYDLHGVIGGDNYLTHYKARNDAGEDFIITEFYPAYMVKREDDGTLGISERFEREFAADREEFIKRAEGFQEIRDASVHPVIEVIERNKTAYIVRRACSLTTVDQFMGHQTMDYDEAYFFVRPLIVSMAKAADKNMIFSINQGDFRVNAFEQLVLAAPVSWDIDFHPPLIQLVKLYYRLVTGTEATAGAPGFSAYGIEMPPRVEAFIMEIIGGDILYGSLDDFYKRFKSLVENAADSDADDGKKTLSVMRGVAAVLLVLLVLSLTVLVYGVVLTHQRNTAWANPDNFADAYALPTPYHDFSDITITHPRNSGDSLAGSFATYDGFLLFRSEGGLTSRLYADVIFVPGAMGMAALADDRIIAEGALPSSIVGHDGFIYFVDAASDGVIYRVTPLGTELERFTEYPALNLAVIGDYLFYTDVRRNHHLYVRHFDEARSSVLVERPVYATLASGTHLFFFAGADDQEPAALFSLNTAEDGRFIRLSDNAAGEFRVFGDRLFYLNTDGQVQMITFEGRRLATFAPENVRTFDIFFHWLFFIEEGRNIPRAYNMNTGEFFTLSSTEWVSYIWAHDGQVYAIDNRNPTLTHRFDFPR